MPRFLVKDRLIWTISKSIPFCASSFLQKRQPVDYADPLTGTSESRWMLNPGAILPFGMVQLIPENQAQGSKEGYEYTISSIFGFNQIHSWTMSGLSVMSAIGLFQTNEEASVKPFYKIGSPLFKKVKTHLNPDYYPGKTFVIVAKHASAKNKYIQSAVLDGKKLMKPWFFMTIWLTGVNLS